MSPFSAKGSPSPPPFWASPISHLAGMEEKIICLKILRDYASYDKNGDNDEDIIYDKGNSIHSHNKFM